MNLLKLITFLSILLSGLSCSTNVITTDILSTQRVPASESNKTTCNILLSRLIGGKTSPYLKVPEGFLDNVGDNLTVLKGNYGEKKVILLDQNADLDSIKKALGENFHFDETLKTSDFLSGIDGERWVIENLDDYGKATLRSNSNTVYLNTGIYRSHVYEFEIDSIPHSLTITIPPLKNGQPDKETLERLTKTVKELPIRAIKELNEINVHSRANRWDKYWGNEYGTKWLPKIINESIFESVATAGGKTISLFPAGNSPFMLDLFRHELGHVLASSIYGKTMPDNIWKAAIEADGLHVSSYAEKSMAEDFAETVMEYFKVKGGVKDSGLFKPSYQKYEARFRILDEYFQANLEQYRKALDSFRSARRIRLTVGLTTVTFVSGSSYYIFFSDDEAS